jgi:hypothetical protein
MVDPAAIDATVDLYENRVGPRNGARVVARAWVDPAYKKRLLDEATGTAAIAELGYSGAQGEYMIVLENTPKVHNLVVCTLCSDQQRLERLDAQRDVGGHRLMLMFVIVMVVVRRRRVNDAGDQSRGAGGRALQKVTAIDGISSGFCHRAPLQSARRAIALRALARRDASIHRRRFPGSRARV